MTRKAPTADPPAWVMDLFGQADAARRAGRHALALAIYRRVCAAAPDLPAAVQHLGALLTVLGRRSEAETVLRQAVALDPGGATARHALALTLLALGRYGEARELYEARFETPGLGLRKPAGLPFPEWRGEDLAGKRIWIFPEMGFGDQIQHARFALTLRDRGAAVGLLCAPELERLFAASLAGVEVAPARGAIPFAEPDVWAMSVSLMGLLDMTPETLPNAPYLHAPAPEPPLPSGFDSPALKSSGFKVGLVTAGSPTHGNDANRSLPPQDAERLRAALPGQVVDLTPAATGARDFADTAALMEGLDLVVSVDTSAVHLAGALGKRTLALIPAIQTDWRWMHDREDSPWYPSLTLYRADPKAGWAPALERLVRDAQALAGG